MTLVLNEYLHVLKGILNAKEDLLHSLPSRDWSSPSKASSMDSDSDNSEPSERRTPWPEADAWAALSAAANECQVKIHSEMRYVKREVVFGKLTSKDFVSITKLLRNILVPIVGLETVIHVGDRVEKQGGWSSIKFPKDASGSGVFDQSTADVERERWNSLFTQLRETFQRLLQAMIEGLDYAFFKLEITKKPAFSTKEELEAKGAESADGKGFAKYLEKTIEDFLTERGAPMTEWCRLNGMDDAEDSSPKHPFHPRHRSQLYLLLDVSVQSPISLLRGHC